MHWFQHLLYFGDTFVAGHLILALHWVVTGIYKQGIYALTIFLQHYLGQVLKATAQSPCYRDDTRM